ncbi:MAG: hypothetical protein FJX77_12325, partial [Armatimonadetes bacterium]|nr:hypothetical protein [Armatimonadota bacterium]
MDAPEAWDLTTGSPSIIVAVIDTGVDHTHPDLRDNILRDAGGAVVGFDFANNDADPRDDNDHGTHVAGIVGAVGNNATGVTGVCQRVRLMPLKFLDAGGGGEISDAIRCIDFARMNGARIMNNSWGGGSPSALLQEAVRRARDAGILFVAAAGNDGANNDVVESVPANLNAILSNVLSVGATTRDDSLASFSNFGARSVDLAAPGDEILSTTPGNTYSVFSGTSMSTPLVSGAAALILARLPGLSLEQLKQRILATVDRPAALNGVVRTGRLNVRNALEEDNVAPGAPTGLAVTHVSSSGMRVSWTASGDDEGVGTASAYDLRFSRSPITPDNFAAAAPVPTTPLPEAAGTPQSTLIANLEPGAAYHLALRALDNVGNPSPLVIAGPASTRAVTCLLQDDGEGTPLFSGPAPWAVTTEKRASPSHSYTDSPGALYGNMLNLALTQTTAVNSPAETARLAFQASLDLEAGFDFLLVEGSGDGGRNWVELDRLTGTSDFKGYSYALSLLGGSALRVRFRLVTDASVVGNGVWLDDIRICTTPTPELRLSDNAEAAGLFAATSPWAITAEQSVSPTQSYSDSPRGNYRNWVDVSITQNTPARLDNILADLTFQVQTDLEPGFDFLHVELSTDGGANWQRLHLLTGRQGWNPVSLSLARFFGTAVRIRFRLTSD